MQPRHWFTSGIRFASQWISRRSTRGLPLVDCGMRFTPVTPADVAATPGLDDWRVVLRSAIAEFRCGTFTRAAAFAHEIAIAPDAADHHPDVHLRSPDRARVVLTTFATNGLTTLDLELARTISALAAARGAVAEPAAAQLVEIAVDTMDESRIRPFWTAVLGYRDDGEYLVDPEGIGPAVWFQQMTEPRPGRGRLHIDVDVPHDVALDRIEAALAAGGLLVTDEFARAWWVLADADGNEVCVCTWQDRDPRT